MIILSLGFILLVAVGLWAQLNYVKKSRAALKVEKDRSEALLLNILPEEIALKYGRIRLQYFASFQISEAVCVVPKEAEFLILQEHTDHMF